MSEFTKTLVVSPLSDGRTWVLREPFSYDIGAKGSGNTITVPERFITDFASVPRLLWAVLPPWGKYGNAAVVHDFGYWEHSRSRKETDQVFLEGMEALGVGWLTRHMMYAAVRAFGNLAWSGRRKQRADKPTIHLAQRLPAKTTDSRQSLQ